MEVMEEKHVTEDVCAERQKNAAERFARDKERLDKVEDRQDKQEERTQKIETLTVQTAEILKRHDAALENHDKRIGALEGKPGKLWDTLITEVIKLLASGAVGAVIAYLTIKP
jgi:hypothetical protein